MITNEPSVVVWEQVRDWPCSFTWVKNWHKHHCQKTGPHMYHECASPYCAESYPD